MNSHGPGHGRRHRAHAADRGSATIPAAEDRPPVVDLHFPDQPRLELDQLLPQLIERAREVMAAQGRLRGLLRANQLIVDQLELPSVLRDVVVAARDLVGARYAALGVIGPDGALAEFVHDGMSPAQVTATGRLPEGKGLLGALIDDPRPIRLDRIAADGRSSGFPQGHPPMDGFLGVPIRIRDEVYGNLYLTESTRGGFSSDDEELVTALAGAAAAAIDHARRFDAARSRQRWLHGAATVSQQLLAPGCPDPWAVVASTAREVSGAAAALLLRLVDDGRSMRVDTVAGDGAQHLVGLVVETGSALSGQVPGSDRPLRRTDAAAHPIISALAAHLDVGPVALVPLRGPSRLHGVLALARPPSDVELSQDELDMAAGFTDQAAIALELAESRAAQQRSAMLDERDRIADELREHVIRRLFAVGLSLQGVAAAQRGQPTADRITEAVRDLDGVIQEIRDTVFVPDAPSGRPG